jgi:hypothetical protein
LHICLLAINIKIFLINKGGDRRNESQTFT